MKQSFLWISTNPHSNLEQLENNGDRMRVINPVNDDTLFHTKFPMKNLLPRGGRINKKMEKAKHLTTNLSIPTSILDWRVMLILHFSGVLLNLPAQNQDVLVLDAFPAYIAWVMLHKSPDLPLLRLKIPTSEKEWALGLLKWTWSILSWASFWGWFRPKIHFFTW